MVSWIGGISMAIALAMILRDFFRADRLFAAVFLAWSAAFVGISLTPLFEAHFGEFPPLQMRLAVGLLVALILTRFFARGRRFWSAIRTERMVQWHWVRAPIGLCFVLAASSGELAPQFGQRAGWGDLVAGVLAAIYVLLPFVQGHLTLLAWDLIGFVDLCVAVGTAMLTMPSLVQAYPFAEQMRMMARPPFVWVPGLLVPVLFFTHGLLAARVFREKAAATSRSL